MRSGSGESGDSLGNVRHYWQAQRRLRAPLAAGLGPSQRQFRFWAWWDGGSLYTSFEVSDDLGRYRGGSTATSNPLEGGKNLHVDFHSGRDGADSGVIVTVAPPVSTARLWLSDGSSHDADLQRLDGPVQTRIGVVVFAADRELRRAELFGADGRALPVHEFGP